MTLLMVMAVLVAVVVGWWSWYSVAAASECRCFVSRMHRLTTDSCDRRPRRKSWTASGGPNSARKTASSLCVALAIVG